MEADTTGGMRRSGLAWRYLGWVALPLLVGLGLARYAGPTVAVQVERAQSSLGADWAAHLHAPLGLFLMQLLVLLLVAKGAGWLFRRFGQPGVIGEMAAGLMMGPLVLGALLPQVHGALFPAASLGSLGLLSQLGVLMFLLVAVPNWTWADCAVAADLRSWSAMPVSQCRSCWAWPWRSGCTRRTRLAGSGLPGSPCSWAFH